MSAFSDAAAGAHARGAAGALPLTRTEDRDGGILHRRPRRGAADGNRRLVRRGRARLRHLFERGQAGAARRRRGDARRARRGQRGDGARDGAGRPALIARGCRGQRHRRRRPGGGSAEKPVGLVHFACAGRGAASWRSSAGLAISARRDPARVGRDRRWLCWRRRPWHERLTAIRATLTEARGQPRPSRRPCPPALRTRWRRCGKRRRTSSPSARASSRDSELVVDDRTRPCSPALRGRKFQMLRSRLNGPSTYSTVIFSPAGPGCCG